MPSSHREVSRERKRHLSFLTHNFFLLPRDCPRDKLGLSLGQTGLPVHPHLFDDISLTDTQLLFTRHAYHCLCQVLKKLLTNQFSPQTTGVTVFHEYTLRFEFQRRGTLHVHVLAWASLHLPASILSGQTGKQHKSPLVTLLEKIFRGNIDVLVLVSLHSSCPLCHDPHSLPRHVFVSASKPHSKQHASPVF